MKHVHELKRIYDINYTYSQSLLDMSKIKIIGIEDPSINIYTFMFNHLQYCVFSNRHTIELDCGLTTYHYRKILHFALVFGQNLHCFSEDTNDQH